MKRTLVVVVGLFAVSTAMAQSGAMKDMDMKSTPMKSDQGRVHKGTGVVKSVDPQKGTVTLAHEPIPSMSWPAMTMSFKVKDGKMPDGLAAGKKVDFEFVEQGKDHVITTLK